MLDDGDDTSDLMPEIVEAVNDIETESEAESEEEPEPEPEPKEDIIIDDAFEKKEDIPNEKLGVKITPIKKETPKNELVEQIKENLEKETPKEMRRRKQLAHLKMMRERKKILAEETFLWIFLTEEKEKLEDEPQTPRPKKEKNFLEKSSIKKEDEEPKYEYKNISLTEEQLKELLEEASVKSIVKYKAQKKKKEKKEEPKVETKTQPVKINPIDNLVYQNEVNYFSSFF